MLSLQESREPLFVFETAVKLLSFSWLVYNDSPGSALAAADCPSPISVSGENECTQESVSREVRSK